MTSDECGMTNGGRRGFLKKLLGAVVAPKVAEVDVPWPLVERHVGVDWGGELSTLAHYVMVMDPGTGCMNMFTFRVIDGTTIKVEKLGGTALT